VVLIPEPPAVVEPRAPEAAGLSIVIGTDLNGHVVGSEPDRDGAAAWAARVNRVPEPRLVIDNGDAWNGGSISNTLDGRPIQDLFETVGVVAVNLGNNEFDRGLEPLRALARTRPFTLLAGNVFADGRPVDFARPFVVFERGAVKVGIVGLQSPALPTRTRARHTAGLTFVDPTQVLDGHVRAMRALGAEIVVVLMHEDPAVVRRFMQTHPLEGIDLVVASDRQPGFHTRVRGVPMVQPGGLGRSIAVAKVIRRRGRARVHRVWLDDKPAPTAPDVAAMMAQARSAADAILRRPVGRLERHLPVGDFHRSPLGQFTADAWLDALSDADAALLNHGALRHPLLGGEVTEKELRNAIAYDDQLVVVTLTGAQLRQGLARGPVVGGFRWTYTVDRRGGRRPLALIHRDGYTIDEDRVLRVVMPEFMAEGGDGFPFSELPRRPTGLTLRDPVRRALDGRPPLGQSVRQPRASYVPPRRAPQPAPVPDRQAGSLR
jgi:2',3'-cyclic-nucleotide 2'-phosphodiesterase (5'-nucleotidase family)